MGISRREAMQKLMGAIAAGAVAPAIAGAHPVELYRRLTDDGDSLSNGEEALGAADWKPIFLNAQQDELLVAVSETMLPGSKGAQVDQFIDLLLSVDSAVKQKRFLSSLTAADDLARSEFQHGFAELNAADREKALTSLSQTHKEPFENLKEWIVGAYYSSEQGMKELGWDGNFAFDKYPTCKWVEGGRRAAVEEKDFGNTR
ncbi:MAG: gluconate 2-dehydrogenase subunit 3 family protein [Acidobacteria bacterium]|nr:gluconate 2-dehydrogenase subunit 3 family protein [Acidobacteriota bacterium]